MIHSLETVVKWTQSGHIKRSPQRKRQRGEVEEKGGDGKRKDEGGSVGKRNKDKEDARTSPADFQNQGCDDK